jgi:hypothetical protein
MLQQKAGTKQLGFLTGVGGGKDRVRSEAAVKRTVAGGFSFFDQVDEPFASETIATRIRRSGRRVLGRTVKICNNRASVSWPSMALAVLAIWSLKRAGAEN